MAQERNKLTALAVRSLTKHGRHSDGGNLYLVISEGSRRWSFMFRWHGRTVELGFGSARDVTLARARELAKEARAQLATGVRPKSLRKGATVDSTFGFVADELISSMESGWRNEKHRAQWKMTLTKYCKPLRPLAVDAIGTDDVLSVLRPIWQTKPETASRIRGRIERVLDAAKARGLRSGENPARWRGHLDQLLQKRQRLTRGHHKALPYPDVPGFMHALRARVSIAARALEFTVLTAARSGETLGARWSEIDLDRGIWTVPAERMKAGREHRVPLSARALEIVTEQFKTCAGDWVFPSEMDDDKPLSSMALAMILRRMKVDATVHGMRSSFRDWSAECTEVANEVCEAALAHTIENKAEAAYRRGDQLQKRRALMDTWATYCGALSTGKPTMAVDAARIQRAVLAHGIVSPRGITRIYEHGQNLIMAGANDDELIEGVGQFSRQPKAQ